MKNATIDPSILSQFPHLKGRKETPMLHRVKRVREGAEDKLSAEQVRRHERRAKIVTRSHVSEEDYVLVV